MNRILAIALVFLLVAISWSPIASQTSSRITLEFSEDEEDSLGREESIIIEEDEGTRRVRTRSGDMVRFGEDIIIEASERIHGDVIAVGGSVRVRGIVDGDVAAIGGDVHIEQDGDVRGEAISIGGQVEEHGRGRVSGSSVSLPSFPHWFVAVPAVQYARGFGGILEEILTLALLLLLAWGLSKLAPDRTAVVAGYVRRRPGPSFLWGLLAVIGLAPSVVAVVIVAVILCITIIGIPVAILLLVGYFVGLVVLLVVGYLVGASVVGRWLSLRFRPLHGEPSLWRSLLIGVVALAIPDVLDALLRASWLLGPIAAGSGKVIEAIGDVVCVVVALFGIGAVLGSRGGQPEPSYAATAAGPPPGAPPAAPPPTSSPLTPPPGPAPAAPPAPPPTAPGAASGTGEPTPP
jgi:hypothetical protein